jgi:hypothetical protein
VAERASGTAQPLTTGSFTLGVNLPWVTYGCDFGGNAWFPDGGVGRADARARANDLLARLSSAGLTTVRWFVFCDGRAGVRFDDAGGPLGLDEFVVRDIDAALAMATASRLSVIFVLLDFPWSRRRLEVRGATLGGHRGVVARADLRNMLLDRVVTPVLTRYGSEPVIAAWDLFNEPEWVTLGYGGMRSGRPVLPGTMKAFLRESCAAARAAASQPITVGLASSRGLPLVAGCGLDLYQVHWYDRRERRAPLGRPPLALLDRPLLLGEFPSAGCALPVVDVLRIARGSGYCGALAWSAAAEDRFSDLTAVEQAAARLRP